LENLQRKYDNLQTELSHQQNSSSSLGPSTWSPDSEIRTLTEEKAKLQSRVKALETQVKNVIKSREEAQQESEASRNQYMQIMAMSSRLQTQTAADLRRWQAEKEGWEKQQTSLLRRIQHLERSSQVPGELSATDADAWRSPDGQESMGILRTNIDQLERTHRRMETVMRELNDEAGNLDDAVQIVLRISTCMQSKVQQALSVQSPSGRSSREQDTLTAQGRDDMEEDTT
jgi:chromosome segregation ATPase